MKKLLHQQRACSCKADGTAYRRTKYRAERYLKDSNLSWTIIPLLAAVLGQRKLMLPVSAPMMGTAASLLKGFESFSITQD